MPSYLYVAYFKYLLVLIMISICLIFFLQNMGFFLIAELFMTFWDLDVYIYVPRLVGFGAFIVVVVDIFHICFGCFCMLILYAYVYGGDDKLMLRLGM